MQHTNRVIAAIGSGILAAVVIVGVNAVPSPQPEPSHEAGTVADHAPSGG